MNVFFQGGSAELTDTAIERLDAVADYLIHDANISTAYVEGHSDAAGETGRNFELSKQRAEAAYNYLLQRGVNESKLKLRYYGQRRPIASNKTASGRAKNRRVSLRLIK
jgi:outer membrane protein OmpA-like peptidoglycan-associated protein